MKFWSSIEYPTMSLSLLRDALGRPKRARRKEEDEPKNFNGIKRRGISFKCGSINNGVITVGFANALRRRQRRKNKILDPVKPRARLIEKGREHMYYVFIYYI